jgi:L-threonylcarbamoyladenylate synthase
MKTISWKTAEEKLKEGDVVILPTDTLYGITASVKNRQAVEKVYSLKKRNPDKPVIVLISSLDDLSLFDIQISNQIRFFLTSLWPGKVTVILPCYSHLHVHRGVNSIAFRIPNNQYLLALIKQVGPIIAPSANTEGNPPATTTQEACVYFKKAPLYYVEGGKIQGKPSTLISVLPSLNILREGAVDTYSIKKMWSKIFSKPKQPPL